MNVAWALLLSTSGVNDEFDASLRFDIPFRRLSTAAAAGLLMASERGKVNTTQQADRRTDGLTRRMWG